ncbi:MAG: hypothetical protein AB2L22_12870 [Syntrophales bacterium]
MSGLSPDFLVMATSILVLLGIGVMFRLVRLKRVFLLVVLVLMYPYLAGILAPLSGI